jgi:hypothetical protein
VKRVKECAEVIVRLDYMDQMAHICVSAWPRMNNKMKKLYGISRDGRNTPDAARWLIPLRCISFRSLGKRTGKVPTQRPAIQRSPEKS